MTADEDAHVMPSAIPVEDAIEDHCGRDCRCQPGVSFSAGNIDGGPRLPFLVHHPLANVGD